MKIAILGGGSWGTALAVHLAKNDNGIKVWEFFEEQAKEMQEGRVCKLLPEAKLPENIFVSHKIEEVLSDFELLLLVVPSNHVEKTIEQAKEFIQEQAVIICSKGFGSDLKFLSDVVKEKISGEVYCLYGPTHAEEVCKDMYSGIVLAGGKGKEGLQKVIASDSLKVDLTDDLIGVQVAAALKNILAVFVGVLDGMGLGDNAKAYIMTRGLQEIKDVGVALGAKEETFYGLAGIGDMIVTSTSPHSRNRSVGVEVGKGRKLQEVIDEMAMVAEGVTTLKEAIGLKEKTGLELPLISGLYEILFEGKDPQEILKGI
ncbi:NAD(P)-dependent glycerol-3-phosphate dehydrogenase [Candidatus Woesearchaeota archaeon]|jgi:glycerol-3-phosphate dehydrogenase (NAD(P)+)|nr:NAD(P)-dependent glycerol-3-phosphate dehydrogenase [Candidatus Woesearchaeota archaeon]MBT4110332.1 NAD(P)-dependent glycerol-3-phosphate dehydrogenase [Candidatus Woesearchaeota archaeon]MBT4336144.1 NAD(P)-dependent glycerol-3-phosphate dehydrogenase [Candidatus Woesearchaeota archaeon]MBT4468877.1 NAD(P)-dependent glycerol-3-phosphate dehydrogenase [Candidatus Woesearchaeota archaeon]MBT6744804.1 NAD(P)-dependent glycerol-3-phosphate dehydrogenase [Candidatus Woesearchaeota archaeon]